MAEHPRPPAGGGPDDIERRLAEALQAEASRTVPAGDGLARIRSRTARRPGIAGWFFRPSVAGGALAIALVAGTLIGVRLTDGTGDSTVVEGLRPPLLAVPAATDGPDDEPTADPSADPGTGPTTGSTPPPVDGGPTDAEPEDTPSLDPSVFGMGGGEEGPNVTMGAVTEPDDEQKTDGGIPEDTGGNYVAITAPYSGSVVGRTFSLEGQARVFEATVSIDVSQNGSVLRREYTTATAGAPEKGSWSKTLTLAPGDYRIDAYTLSAADGETRLASDTIWITVAGSGQGADGGDDPPPVTPDPEPEPEPTADPEPTPDPGAGEVPAVEPDPATRPDPAARPDTDASTG